MMAIQESKGSDRLKMDEIIGILKVRGYHRVDDEISKLNNGMVKSITFKSKQTMETMKSSNYNRKWR